jgi:ADP-ribose pyrophosphatase
MSIPKLCRSFLCPSIHTRAFSQMATSRSSPSRYSSFASGLLLGSAATGGGAYWLYQSKERAKPEQEFSARMKAYFDLLDKYPKLGPMGDAEKGDIQIVRDPKIIAQIEKQQGQKTGILYRNKWQIWIADPVQFPKDPSKKSEPSYGIYGRFLWNQTLDGPAGVAIMPVMPDGRILVISIYRHSLRKRVLEFPRGNAEGLETLVQKMNRELGEETGAKVKKVVKLGNLNADSGITSGGVSIVKAVIDFMGDTKRDPAEASITMHFFTPQELDDAIRKGSAKIQVNGEWEDVEIGTDSFMLAALELNRLKG